MRTVFFLTFILMILVGCATAHKMNDISLGMTKQQVFAILGTPVSTSATSGVEYLNYRFSETADHAYVGITTSYYVQIVDGKVVAYGRSGDFKVPETKSTVDVNIKK